MSHTQGGIGHSTSNFGRGSGLLSNRGLSNFGRRSGPGHGFERMEAEATAKRRRTRRVVRRLHNRREENMTLDEMLASAMLDEMLDEEGTPAMEVDDIAFVGECSWAERDAESRARAVDLGD